MISTHGQTVDIAQASKYAFAEATEAEMQAGATALQEILNSKLFTRKYQTRQRKTDYKSNIFEEK